MGIVRQSTARTILVGPVLDSTGAAKTDEVVGSLRVTKNGVVGSINGSATLTHNHTGKYLLAYTAADVDTVGITEISLESGTNDMPVVRLNVVEEPVFDALFAGSATGFGNTGSGARTVTITVDDGTTPLQTAKVRLAQGGEAYVGETNVSGVIVFALDMGCLDYEAWLLIYADDTGGQRHGNRDLFDDRREHSSTVQSSHGHGLHLLLG
jgi:hypothetical protein